MSTDQTHETILILDFGSQYTQLIARRIREIGVFSEILPYSTDLNIINQKNIKGIIFYQYCLNRIRYLLIMKGVWKCQSRIVGT